VKNTTDLQKMVSATAPGTTVPLKVMRNKKEQTVRATVEELDLEAERGGRQSRNNNDQQPEVQGQDSFGLTLGNLSPQMARRLQLPSGQTGAVVTDVDDNGPSAGILRQGDVILSVNGQSVSSAAEAGRELQKVAAGRIARILVWRGDGEVFLTIRKE
jgi:serine protease Do